MAWGFFPRVPAPGPQVESSPEPDESLVTGPTEASEVTPFEPSNAHISAITNLLSLQLDASRRHDAKIDEVQAAISAIRSEFNAAVLTIKADHDETVKAIKLDHHAIVKAIKADHEANVKAMKFDYDASVKIIREDHNLAVKTIRAGQDEAIKTMRADHNAAVQTMRADFEAHKLDTLKQIRSLSTVEALSKRGGLEQTIAPARSLETPDASDHNADPNQPVEQPDFDIGQYINDSSPEVEAVASGSGSDDVQIISPNRHVYWKEGVQAAQTREAATLVVLPASMSTTVSARKASGVKTATIIDEQRRSIVIDHDNDAAGPSMPKVPTTPERNPRQPLQETVDAATGSGRSRRSGSKRKDYHSHPLDGIINRKGLTPKRSRRDSSIRARGESSPLRSQTQVASSSRKSKEGSATSGKGQGSGKGKGRPPKAAKATKGKRTFYGRVTMNDQTLKASDGDKRGNGTWPVKGENTVKGNIQEIECDICNGRVHWACAGFEDDTIAPDQWECPDCELKLKHGLRAEEVTPGPRDRCLRATCIKKDHKKIQVKDGDQDQYVVERFIGRRAVARNPDDTRVFEYLVSWYDWPLETATWEAGDKFPPTNPFTDEFLRECSQHGIKTKPRVVLLPEALKYFDAYTGKNLNEESSDEEEEEVETVPPNPTVDDEEKTDD